MTTVTQELAVIALAEIVHSAYCLALLQKNTDLDIIKAKCKASGYWPEFVRLNQAGELTEEWLSGNRMLGRLVLMWAK